MQEKLKSLEIEVPLHISVSVISHLIGARRSMKIDFFFFFSVIGYFLAFAKIWQSTRFFNFSLSNEIFTLINLSITT